MRLFSTEQVTKYHPDKLCDQISDAILDACLAQDPDSHVACECMAKGETIILAGEITTTAKVDYAGVASRVCAKLGYKASNVLTYIEQQSPRNRIGRRKRRRARRRRPRHDVWLRHLRNEEQTPLRI